MAYIPEEGFAVTFGNPLCELDQVPQVVRAYLTHVKEEHHLKPVWCCVDKWTEKYLAQDLGWSAVIAVAEERLNPIEVSLQDNKTIRRKVHRAEREGVLLHEINGDPDETFRQNIEQRLQDWKATRRGNQIHLTGLRPFDDVPHRRYFYATDKVGKVWSLLSGNTVAGWNEQTNLCSKICCFLVLAQLAATHGFQIKWVLEFPGAPTGAIEVRSIISYVHGYH